MIGHLDGARRHHRAGRRPAGRGRGRRQGHDHAAERPDDTGHGDLGRHGGDDAVGEMRARPPSRCSSHRTTQRRRARSTRHPSRSPSPELGKNAFVVPVDALLALVDGGYALEVVSADGRALARAGHHRDLRRCQRDGAGERHRVSPRASASSSRRRERDGTTDRRRRDGTALAPRDAARRPPTGRPHRSSSSMTVTKSYDGEPPVTAWTA